MKLRKIDDDQYEIVDKGEENFHHILLKESSPYAGVIFQYGGVRLLEEDGQLRVKFEYEVFENPDNRDTQSQEFRDYLGHILLTNLEEILIFNKYKRSQQE